MKLLELDSKSKARQNKRVFESQFGQKLSVERLTVKEAKKMLNRVRRTIAEHRATAAFHRSERNPAYLKLMVMEQALAAHVSEQTTVPPTAGAAAAGTPATKPQAPGAANTAAAQNPQAAKAMAQGAAKMAAATGSAGQAGMLTRAIQSAAAGKSLGSAERTALAQNMKGLEALLADPTSASKLQGMMKAAVAENMKGASRLQRKLMEAEVQQAQVVLAAQDMVDRVQKMLEEVTAMQFKDLPALVDSIRNEVGMDQAQQFNGEATAALGALVQNLQGSKTQLESAQGILTGQAPVVPGEDLGGAEMGADMGSELPPPEGEVDVDADVELPGAEEEEDELMNLGRGRR